VYSKQNESESIYNFTGGDVNKTFSIGTLDKGIYNYEAVTVFNGENFSSNGQFIIKDTQLESTTFTANHNLLKKLSDRTGGKFYQKNEIDLLIKNLGNSQAKSVIQNLREFDKMINFKWILIIILTFFSLEWFFRKYLGSY
jgi:hypothetical protein